MRPACAGFGAATSSAKDFDVDDGWVDGWVDELSIG